LSVKDFGAVGNGVADDTLAIQAAIDSAIYTGIPQVYMPEGIYKVSNTINVGYGVGYCSVSLIGAGAAIVSVNWGNPYTQIVPTFNDRPVINIQGVRDGGCRNLYINAQAVNTFTPPWSISLAATATQSNYYNGVKTTANAPFCGVCIDGYSGSAPASPYPTPTYPAYLGVVSSAYGKNFSSRAFANNCAMQATFIGICQQPNSDGNADFSNFSHNSINDCAIGISIGNVNARNNDYSNAQFGGCHTLIDSVSYAAINKGNFTGNLSNISADRIYRIFNVNLDYATSFSMSNFYCENMMTIGTLSGGKSKAEFNGCLFECIDYKWSGSAITEIYSVPTYTSGTSAVFNACTFSGSRIGFWFNGTGDASLSQFNGCLFRPAIYDNASLYRDANEKIAADAWFGVFCFENANVPGLSQKFINCLNLNYANYDSVDTFNYGFVHSVGCSNGAALNYLTSNYNRRDQQGGTFLNPTTNTGGGFSTTAAHGAVGDVIYVDNNNCFYYLASITAGTYQWNALFNFTYTTGGGYSVPAFSASQINWWRNAAFYKMSLVGSSGAVAFKTTAGSAVVTLVDASYATVTPPFSTSALILYVGGNAIVNFYPALPFPPSTTINTIIGNNITMTANAQITGYWAISGILRLQ
jgi:hypothetical protein